MSCTLGVDIGTFETKGVLVDGDGRIRASAAVPHDMIVPRPGWAEHRAEEDWWDDFCRVSQAVIAEAGVDPADIDCVATSAIGPCMLPVGPDGKPLMNAVLYGVDTRAEAEIAELTSAIGPDMLLERCGNALSSQSVGPKILWLQRNRPEIFRAAAKFLTSTSFLVHRLTGEYVVDHYTAASFSPLYDVEALGWSDRIGPQFVELERLPKLCWSTEIAGAVTPGAAEETGLRPGTPVTCGTIDAAAEAMSVGVRDPGDMMMMYGSTVFIILLADARTADHRLWYAPWLFPGQHAAMAGMATSGTLTHWFRDNFARELPRDAAFEALAAEAAASPPGAKGLLLLPYFSGERSPIQDPQAKGVFFGLNLTHGRGDLYRALLEGIANGTAHVVDTYREIGQAPARILAVGGGTRNRIWLQSTSDIADLPQLVCEKTIGASYGDAFLAACAVGHARPEDIAVWNPVSETVMPARHAALARQYKLFRRLYAQTKDIARELGQGDGPAAGE